VYKARQLTTGQAVALKVMRPVDLADAARTARRAVRFRREMDLCAQLHHPNIVHLIDSGQTDDGLLYAVFAFVPGETLADVLAREGMLGMAETRHLMMQVLDALTCAHDLGVVHRDLKPRNIMVQSTGARRNAIVLDLGLGVLVHGEQQAQETRLTETGEALGTPGYAAPEQLRGRDASPRADLFSWGLVLLECLTGRPVYSGISTAEILYAQLSPEPVPIPARLQDHPLGDLLFRVTHKDEAARAVTARALLAELEACDVDRPGMRRASDATAAAGERRQVTALCCTLDGDDEVLAGQLAACAEVVERHGGHVAAALGHALLAYFGYPRAEEDDARRAARAGLAIAAHAGAGAARLGIHTGVVVVGGRTDPAAGLGTGETPGVAARLSAAAAPGTVVVTGETRRLLRDAYLFDAEGVLPRGAGDPPRVYRIRQISTDRETVAIATPASDAAPLIGRDQEMRLLFERWGRSRRGAGQCSLITGEPGIGKSRLARELRAHLADESHTFLAGRSSPEARNIALYPVTDLLGRALGLDRETEAADKIARLEDQVGRHGMDRADAMPLLLPLFGLPGGETYPAPPVSLQRLKELTLATVLGLLLALADERPTLLLLEDLHWSDATTLELVEQLIHEAPSAPMCVVLTARPEFAPPFPTIGLLQLHLGRLERLEVETMVRGLMKGKRLPAEVVERVADRTDGIPLFVEELVRMLSESGVLVERDDRHELVGSLSDAAIPTSLRDLLAARLDRLGRARETAQIAAALGREFDADLLHAVSPHPGAAREDLEVLLGAGLIHRKRRQRDSIMVFRHALIRDAAYDSLPPAARRETHARIATALEERFPAIAQARPDLVAHHLALADRRPHAIPYALRAARAALAHSANVEAIGHAREALGWLGAIDDPRQRAEHELDLNSAITMALMSSKGYGTVEVAAIVQRSQELVDSLGATPHAVPTLWANFMYHHLQNHRAQARGIAERLVGLGRAAGDVGGEVAALPILGQCFYIEGRLEESRAACERAAELYDPAQHRNHALLYGLDSRAYAELTLGLVLWLQGYPEQAMVRGTAAIAWAKELDHATTIALALLYMVGIHHYQGERARALAVTDELVDLVDRYGLSMIKGFGGILRGWASGDAAGAEASLAELRGSGQELGTSYWLSLVAEAEAAQGKHGAAVGRLDECLRYAEETGEMYYVPELYRLKGSYLLRHRDGAADAAEDCFRRSIDTARRLGTRMAELRSALALHALLQPRGRFDESIALLAPVYRSFTEGFTLPELRDARYILAELT
ncbi:MAG TPA: TOMM system kinase/cyclase fusion protein, partial [Kofleriaceae bacterium]|nr:TOMM system kinase/cyclase fusion protein [Kofleriaceae bacterium]